MEMRMFRMPCLIITGLSVLLAALGATVLAVEKPRLIVLTTSVATRTTPAFGSVTISHRFSGFVVSISSRLYSYRRIIVAVRTK
jgi:hypothetical protein